MTSPNALSQLEAMLNAPSEPTPETDALNKLKAQQEQKATELGDMGENLLRGLFQSLQNPAQTTPDRADFDQRFRQNNSPAREVLANMFQGMSSSFAGTKYKAVREQAWQQELVQAKMKEDAIKADQVYKAQLVKQLQDEVQSRRQVQFQTDALIAKQESEAAKTKEEKKRILANFYMRNHLDAQKINANREMEERKLALQEKKLDLPQNGWLRDGMRMAKEQLLAEGFKETDDNWKVALGKRAVELANDLHQTSAEIDAAAKAKFRPEPRPRHKWVDALNPWGENEGYIVNLDTGDRMFTPTWAPKDYIPRSLSKEDVAKINEARATAGNIKMAIQAFQAGNPDAVVGLKRLLPDTVLQRLGQLPPEAQTFQTFFNAGITDLLHGKSGATVTPIEEKRIIGLLSKLTQTPGGFQIGLHAFSNMLDLSLMRLESGIEPADLDLGEIMEKEMRYLQQAQKDGIKAKPSSARELVEDALKARGKVPIYQQDSSGRIRLRGVKDAK